MNIDMDNYDLPESSLRTIVYRGYRICLRTNEDHPNGVTVKVEPGNLQYFFYRPWKMEWPRHKVAKGVGRAKRWIDRQVASGKTHQAVRAELTETRNTIDRLAAVENVIP